jgi:hypothetical protein
LVFVCNIDKSFEAKMLCLLAVWLAGWLAGWCHTHVATAESINMDLKSEWCVRFIGKNNPWTQSISLLQGMYKIVCQTELGTPEAPSRKKQLLIMRHSLTMSFFKLGFFIWMSLLLAWLLLV